MHLGLKVGDELGDGLPCQGMRQMKRLDIIDSGDLDGQCLPGLLPLPRAARPDAADRAPDRHAYAVLELGVAAAQHGEVAGVRSVDRRLLVESLRREREDRRLLADRRGELTEELHFGDRLREAFSKGGAREVTTTKVNDYSVGLCAHRFFLRVYRRQL